MDEPAPSQVLQENPPLSQASQTISTPIFLNPDGSPMQIFTQADNVTQYRPKFIRKLRSHAASRCSNIDEAYIILVNPDSTQGRQLIRDWGNVEGKHVLHYSWAEKCINAGRPLLADDEWGACVVHDDGLPIENGDEDEAEIPPKSPLPTPRQTPSEPSVSHSWSPDPATHSSASQKPRVRRESSQIPAPPASASSTDTSIITPVDLPSQGPPSFAALSSLNGMQPFLPQYPMQMASMFNPMMMNPQMVATMMANPEAFQAALQDIMTMSKLGPQMQPTLYNPLGQQSPVQEQVLPFPDIPSKSLDTRSNKRRSRSLSPLTRRSLSGLSDSYASTDKKGKQRAISPSSKRRKTSTSSFQDVGASKATGSGPGPSSQSRLFTTKSGRELSFFVQIDLHHRSAVVDAIKKNGGRIEKEPENADYVVLYSGNKRQKTFNDLLKSAQMAGRPAVPSRFVHECVEEGSLLNSSEYEFDSIIKKKRITPVVKKEQSSSEDEMITIEKKRLAKNAREAERRRQLRLEKKEQDMAAAAKARKTSPTHQSKAEEMYVSRERDSIDGAPLFNGRRSPTPPGEHTRQHWGLGYKFSVAESQFALTYGQILVERDHTISSSAIVDKIHQKLPHHTLKSWRTQFAKISQGDLDDWRKRANIAYRKALRQSQLGPSSQFAVPNGNMEEVIELSSSPGPQVQNESTSFRANHFKSQVPSDVHDIEVVSQFFAGLNDTGEPEHTIWARLATQHPHHTGDEWEALYQSHHIEVTARYGELIGSANQ